MPKLTKPRKHAYQSHACQSTTHIRSPTVHEERRDHACPHCAAAFGEAGHLATHVRVMHPDPATMDHTVEDIMRSLAVTDANGIPLVRTEEGNAAISQVLGPWGGGAAYDPLF